jgi:hypothetical protein
MQRIPMPIWTVFELIECAALHDREALLRLNYKLNSGIMKGGFLCPYSYSYTWNDSTAFQTHPCQTTPDAASSSWLDSSSLMSFCDYVLTAIYASVDLLITSLKQ